MEKKKTTIGRVLLFIALLAASFLGGISFWENNRAPKEIIKTEYIKGDTVFIKKEVLTPVYVKVPADTFNILRDCVKKGIYAELFPEKVRDSIVYLTKEDTSAIMRDWSAERVYKEVLFDIDTVGTANVTIKTQYNRLAGLEGNFVPIERHYYHAPRKTTDFLVGASVSTNSTASFNCCVVLKNNIGVMFGLGNTLPKMEPVGTCGIMIKF